MGAVGVYPKTPRALVALAAIGLVFGLTLTGCASAKSKHTQATPASASRTSAATVPPAIPAATTVPPATSAATSTTRPLPSGFLGLSMQYKAFEQYAGTNPKSINPAFLNLIRNIAPNQSPVLRFGGDSTDWTWWPVPGMKKPGGVTYTLTPKWLQIARAMDTALNSRLILGVNLEAASVKLAQTEANALVNGIGKPNIAGLEIGNEPELYSAFNWYAKNGVGVKGRSKSWTEGAFFKQFRQFAGAMPAGVPVAGPASGSAKYLAQLGSFLKGQPRVKLSTFHAYPLKHCTPGKVLTTSQLLSPAATSGFAQAQAQYVNVSHRYGKLARLDEINGITCGGYGGVSNAFGSALWVLDTLFELDKVGVDGVNIQTVPGGVQEIFGPVAGDGGSMVVHPEFYGMMMFGQAAPAGSRLITIPATVPSGVHLWATRATDGTVHVVLINDNFTKSATVSVPLSSPAGPGTLEALRAPHIGATSGVTIGGRTFGAVDQDRPAASVSAPAGDRPGRALLGPRAAGDGDHADGARLRRIVVDDDGALITVSTQAALDGRRRARDTGGVMLNPGEFRRQISIELNAAYGDGLLSEQTLAHRLDLVLSGRLLDPERLIGDLSLRASRRSLRNTVGRGVDSLRDTFTRRQQPSASRHRWCWRSNGITTTDSCSSAVTPTAATSCSSTRPSRAGMLSCTIGTAPGCCRISTRPTAPRSTASGSCAADWSPGIG